MADGEIIVVPFHSSGHIFPAIELSNHLASRNYRIALLLPSTPSDASLHPLIRIVEFSMPHPPGAPPGPPQPSSSTFSSSSPSGTHCSFADFLARRFDGDDLSPPPICAIVDVMMSQLLDICRKFQIPAVSFFTSSACSTALDHAMSKLSMEDLGPGRTVTIPGLPEEMALTSQDLNHRPGHPDAPPPMFGPNHGGPPPHFGPGRGDVRPPGPPSPFEPGRFGGPPPPLRPGDDCAPPLPGPGPHGGPPPSPRRGSPSPPPFGYGHCGGPPAPPTSACGGPHPAPPLGPPPSFGHAHGCRPPPPSRPQDGGAPPPSPDRIGPGHGGGPPGGLADTEGAIALLFNTCDDLERPFLEYLTKEKKKPVWGVGPLLPAAFWSAAGSLVHDAEVRPKRNDSSVIERDVLEWLDSKPRGSVIYVSFGSIVAPSDAELAGLAAGLEESNRPFIWTIQPNAMRHDPAGHPVQTDGSLSEPEGLASRVGGRVLVIRGWAPQLLILSHGATGAFVTHCGWNSTVEALRCGVPMLTWPVHGDQIHNARLVTRRLRAGIAIKTESVSVSKDDVVRGIERVVAGEEVRERAASARAIFAGGFPRTSSASLDAFLNFIHRRGILGPVPQFHPSPLT